MTDRRVTTRRAAGSARPGARPVPGQAPAGGAGVGASRRPHRAAGSCARSPTPPRTDRCAQIARAKRTLLVTYRATAPPCRRRCGRPAAGRRPLRALRARLRQGQAPAQRPAHADRAVHRPRQAARGAAGGQRARARRRARRRAPSRRSSAATASAAGCSRRTMDVDARRHVLPGDHACGVGRARRCARRPPGGRPGASARRAAAPRTTAARSPGSG